MAYLTEADAWREIARETAEAPEADYYAYVALLKRPLTSRLRVTRETADRMLRRLAAHAQLPGYYGTVAEWKEARTMAALFLSLEAADEASERLSSAA